MITCSSCGNDNKPDRRFCRSCGTALSVSCGVCGTANDPGDRFCGNCGNALNAATGSAEDPVPAAETELRFVSVLFADLVSYTTLSEHADSEDIRDLLTVYFERSRAIIERFGGVVDKFIGDAVMGVWGAHQAREDDTERAVRAALDLIDMVAALGEETGRDDLVLRAGVNSGSTAVGPGGNEQGLVVGDIVNTASRLQSIADPGTVFVGRSTSDMTSGAIDYEALGDRQVKGKQDPVEAFRALRVAAMVGGSDGDLRPPPFVGRDRELRLLKDTLDLVVREGRARLISVVGEAGIGKSRLGDEFKHQIDGYSDDIFWHQGRSPSYGDGVTFWAVGEMVRRRAGITESEPDSSARTRLRTMLAEYVSVEGDRQWIEPRLAGLLGLAEMPVDDGEQLSAVIRLLFQHIAARGPTVLVFEDFHWADSGLVELVSDLVERSTRSPILIVTLARTDLLDRVPAWGSQHRSSTAVRLGPLTTAEMRGMLSEYLPGLAADVVDGLATRAAGFPLYAVELVRMLTNTGQLRHDGDVYVLDGEPGTIRLPDSLQAVIGARIDRLDAAERDLLQDAAILGQTFSADALTALRDTSVDEVVAGLDRLIQLEILDLEDDPLSPERGQYGFVQSLIRELVHSRLNRQERRAKHLAVAEYFATFRDPELAGVVAGHFMSAVEATPSGTERDALLERAAQALIEAADRAADLGAHDQALGLLEQSIELAGDSGDPVSLRLLAVDAAILASAVERGLAHADYIIAHGDATVRRQALARKSMLFVVDRRSDEALRVIQPAYESLTDLDDPASAEVAAEMARAMMLNGIEGAAEVVDRLLPTAESHEMSRLVLDALITKATVLGGAKRSVEAKALFRGIAEQARDAGLYATSSRALNNYVASMRYELSHDEMLAGTLELTEDGLRAGVEGWVADVRVDGSSFLAERGDYAGATEMLDAVDVEGLSQSARGGYQAGRLFIDAVTGDPDAALETYLDATAEWAGSDDPQQQGNYDISVMAMHAAAGRWSDVLRLSEAVRAMPGGFFATEALWEAATAAAWLRRGEVVEELRRRHADEPSRRPGFELYLDGIAAALAGDDETAVDRLSRVVTLMDGHRSPLDIATVRTVFSLLLGDVDPVAAEAGRDAYEWLHRTGSHGLLKSWAAAFSHLDDVAATG